MQTHKQIKELIVDRVIINCKLHPNETLHLFKESHITKILPCQVLYMMFYTNHGSMIH